jgi:hypothetical protein
VSYWLLAILALLLLQLVLSAARQPDPLPYSELERYLAEGRIE